MALPTGQPNYDSIVSITKNGTDVSFDVRYNSWVEFTDLENQLITLGLIDFDSAEKTGGIFYDRVAERIITRNYKLEGTLTNFFADNPKVNFFEHTYKLDETYQNGLWLETLDEGLVNGVKAAFTRKAASMGREFNLTAILQYFKRLDAWFKTTNGKKNITEILSSDMTGITVDKAMKVYEKVVQLITKIVNTKNKFFTNRGNSWVSNVRILVSPAFKAVWLLLMTRLGRQPDYVVGVDGLKRLSILGVPFYEINTLNDNIPAGLYHKTMGVDLTKFHMMIIVDKRAAPFKVAKRQMTQTTTKQGNITIHYKGRMGGKVWDKLAEFCLYGVKEVASYTP